MSATFITSYPVTGSGPLVAVKDLIDMAGIPTTAGSRALAEAGVPAVRDAACLAGLRTTGAQIVGRTNLHELALGVTGINPWFGTPRNPLHTSLAPGGSSRGSRWRWPPVTPRWLMGRTAEDRFGFPRRAAACAG